MTTVVTLDVFSGRRNPSLQLSDSDEQELYNRLSAATVMTHTRPSGVVGGLGYRGFLILSHDPTLTAAGQLRVHEGIVDRGINLANVIDNTEIEQFLLSKFQARLAPDV